MKSKLSRSKTEKNYESNKYNFANLKTSHFKLKKKFNHKELKLNSLSNNYNIFSFDEEYVSNLKYKLSELNLNKDTKEIILSDSNINPHFPNINRRNSVHNKLFEVKYFFKENNKDEMGYSKYSGKQENIYKENALEKKRLDLEIKIKKVKNLIQSLSNDLKITINQIENNNLDINVIKNIDFSEGNFRKRLSISLKLGNNNKTNDSNHNNISIDKKKSKEIENMIKLERMKLQKKKLNLMDKLAPLESKKNNIILKLDYCYKNLTELKEQYLLIKNQLINHYHKLLLEGKDTRSEGLSWIIRSIWKLKCNVIMSFLPKFLDNESIEFLFKYSDKLAEIEKIEKIIEEKNKFLKNMGKKITKLSEKLLNIQNNNGNNNNIYKANEEIKNNNENKNNKIENNPINNNKINFNISSPQKKNNDFKQNRTSSKVLLQTIKRRSLLMLNKSPISTLQRILSDTKINKNLNQLNNKNNPEQNYIQKISENKDITSESEETSSSIFNETFKTGLNNTKSSFKDKDSNTHKIHKNNNKIIKNLEIMLNNPDYLEELTSHVSPNKQLKIRDFENMTNLRIENFYDSNLVKKFSEYKELLLKLKEKKKEAEKFVRLELDRIGKCFYMEDYSGKFNTNIKTVIGALIGEDNSRLEIFRQQREQKEYFKIIKNLRTFNLINKKNI